MHNFYCPGIAGQKIIRLPDSELHHALHVMRLKQGETVHLLDGTGNVYTGEIISIHKKECLVQISHTDLQQKNRKIHIHLAVAPVKSADRLAFMLEKCTELGIDEITPLRCRNSERSRFNQEKEMHVVISAIKQSGNAWMPILHEYTDISTFLSSPDLPAQRYIAHCREGDKQHFEKAVNAQHDIVLMIGPEGDFSREEILQAEKNKFTPVSLGSARLRTETAAIAAVQTIHILSALHTDEN